MKVELACILTLYDIPPLKGIPTIIIGPRNKEGKIETGAVIYLTGDPDDEKKVKYDVYVLNDKIHSVDTFDEVAEHIKLKTGYDVNCEAVMKKVALLHQFIEDVIFEAEYTEPEAERDDEDDSN